MPASNPNCWQLAEGYYADLLELVKLSASEAVFMNLPVQSKEAQDENLEMLLAHRAIYDSFQGEKKEITEQ